MHTMRTAKTTAVTVAVAATTVLVSASCSDGTERDPGRQQTATEAATGSSGPGSPGPASSGPGADVEAFLAVARAAGWNCIPGADPYTEHPGATCSPGAGKELTGAVFAVFDRSDVPDGAAAVTLAQDAAGDAAVQGQFLPLDSDTVSGYCVNTLGTCADSRFDTLGLTLG